MRNSNLIKTIAFFGFGFNIGSGMLLNSQMDHIGLNIVQIPAIILFFIIVLLRWENLEKNGKRE